MIKIGSLLEIDTSFYAVALDDFLRSRANPTTPLRMPKEFAEWFERHGGFQWEEQSRTIAQITPFL